ncbi:MAG: TetR/AcrR family transcriptional regulator [Planctomycetota bacterium]|nr:TetR/AcrR family transcriptional regulator [Planctomycetota bacterium]
MAKTDKRRQIMQAAEKLFAAGRFHEITTDEVARVARVGKGTIYRHFRDKEELFFETATSGFDELCDLLREKVPTGGAFGERLHEACVQITGFVRLRREWFGMRQSQERLLPCMAGGFSKRWLAKRQGLVAAVADILREGVAQKAIRADIPPDVLANFLLGLLRTRERDLADTPAALRKYQVVVDMFCRGAGAAGGHGSPGGKRGRRGRVSGKDSAR